MKYEKYSYLFPPRPENTTQFTELGKYDNGKYICQPKYNGTCCVVFINETELVVMNRHKGKITSNYSKIDFRSAYRGKGWMVLCGEFLNKSKKGEDGNTFNLKFIIWDILVYNSEYMLLSTIMDRLNLLEELYPCYGMEVCSEGKMDSYNHLCCTGSLNIYKAPTYLTGFEHLYKNIVDVDLYEGLVMKRRDAKLTLGLTENNNSSWQFKCRKPTKNYKF